MVIKVEDPKQEGYNPTLKLSRLLPFEYVELCKHEYDSPQEGKSNMKDAESGGMKEVVWRRYTVAVSEYNTADPNTGEKVNKTFADPVVMSLFANPTVHDGLLPVPVGEKVRITAKTETGPKGEFTKYHVVPAGKSAAPAADMTLDERIKLLKAEGVSANDVCVQLEFEFDESEDFIRKRYEAL
jgi:hypothetical protein